MSQIDSISIEQTIPFKEHSGQTYEGERLQELMDSISNCGLLCPIIVRPAKEGKYEIICGHNRVKAMKALGHSHILSDIRPDLSDEQALRLYYDSNLNQQHFQDWNYTSKLSAIKYYVNKIRQESVQGKRTDLENKAAGTAKSSTYVQTRHKSERKTTRDRMAQRLGISTATFSKYRRIIQLPDDLVQTLARLLDEKKTTLEDAYIISNMRNIDIKFLAETVDKKPGLKPDRNKLKELPRRSSDNGEDELYPISKEAILNTLIPRNPGKDDSLPVIKRIISD